jgi:hypothetical protein
MALYALYNPVNPHDLVKDAKGKVVTCEELGAVPTPLGHYWLDVTDEIDGTGPGGSHLAPGFNKLGTSEIVLVPPGKAIRRFPLVRE